MDRVLLVNPQNYFWSENMTIDDLQLAEVVRNPSLYRERMQSASAWRRCCRARSIYGEYSGSTRIGRCLACRRRCATSARALRIRLPNDLGRELEDIVRRGVQVTFMFADGEPGIDLLKIQGGSSVRKLGDHCRVRDHQKRGPTPSVGAVHVLQWNRC